MSHGWDAHWDELAEETSAGGLRIRMEMPPLGQSSIQAAIQRALREEDARREAWLDYAMELAIRTRAPVTLFVSDGEFLPGQYSMYEIPAGAEA